MSSATSHTVSPYDELRLRCGFGQMGLCCTDCLQGPCRVNPYSSQPEYGICGRSVDAIVAHQALRLLVAGCASLAGDMARNGQPVPDAQAVAALAGAAADNGASSWADLLGQVRQLSGRLLADGLVPAWTGAPGPVQDVEVGAAPLQSGHPRLLLAGHLPPSARAALVEAGLRTGVQILGIAGGEDLACGVPWVGGFDDIPGILDAVPFNGVVVGSGCVPPLMLAATTARGLNVYSLPLITASDSASYADWADGIMSETRRLATVAASQRRDLPDPPPVLGDFVTLDWPFDMDLLDKAGSPGLALIAGCGVSPGEATQLARELLAAGMICFAAGCVAPELARAGLLAALSGPPPIHYAGTCRQVRRVVDLAYQLRDRSGSPDLPLVVATPGLCQPSMAAIGLGLAARGARVHCGAALPVAGSQAVQEWLASGKRYGAGPLYTEADPPTARQVVARLLR